MKRRVIELVGGQIVRDERRGAYTTTVPVQKPAAPEPSFDDLAAAVPTPAESASLESTSVEIDEVPAVEDPIEALLPAASTAPAPEPIVERTPTSTGAVLPEPGSGPPPGFVWPTAPDAPRDPR
jgi:cell division transport system ATP-binding protein